MITIEMLFQVSIEIISHGASIIPNVRIVE